MNQPFVALGFQEIDSSSMWIILAVVLVILVFIVVVVGVGLTIFFIARKRSKEQKAALSAATPAVGLSGGPAAPAYSSTPPPDIQQVAPPVEPAPIIAEPPPSHPEPSSTASQLRQEDVTEFDPSRTVAISREATVEISYGTIKFVSGVLAGEEFQVSPEGAYIGRESSLSQIVVSDPRISKRHLWIGVRDGVVTVVDQASRNGTFLNDPKSERITDAQLNSGDTVIMGESDVARFEYHS